MTSHQTALDVEGNNIANVNTYGFKYSRTEFQDLMYQTVNNALSPRDDLGGKGPSQIGNGGSVASVHRITTQGATQGTDVATDMAIMGEGYFIVSDDGGDTYKYTRAGNFQFDAVGNLVDPNGTILQGWLADGDYNVDTTRGITDITIDPNMTVPAVSTTKIQVSANLNSGTSITNKSAVRTTAQLNSDFNGLYDVTGNEISMKAGVDTIGLTLKRSYDVDGTKVTSSATYTFTYAESDNDTDGNFLTVKDLLDEINARIKDSTGVYDNRVLLTGEGTIAGAGHIEAIIDSTTTNSTVATVLETVTSGTYQSRSLKIVQNGFVGSDDVGELFNGDGDAMQLKAGQGIKVNLEKLGETRNFVYRESDPSNADSYLTNDFQSSSDISIADADQGFHWTKDSSGEAAFMNVGQQIAVSFNSTLTGLTSNSYVYGTDFQTIQDLINAVNIDLAAAGHSELKLAFDDTYGKIVDEDGILSSVSAVDSTGTLPYETDSTGAISYPVLTDSTGATVMTYPALTDSTGATVTDSTGATVLDTTAAQVIAYDTTSPTLTDTPLARLHTIFSSLGGADSESGTFKKNDTYYFTDMQELVNLYQTALDDAGDELNSTTPIDATVELTENGQIALSNGGAYSFAITTNGYPTDETANQLFRDAMSSLTGTVTPSATGYSQKMYAAIHTSSIEVFDSGGNKHTLTFHFRKEETSQDNFDPTTWQWYVEGEGSSTFEYPASGTISFNLDGSIKSYSPPSITFNPNVGTTSGQIMQLDFGSLNGFDGLTNFAQESETYSSFQDGYAGGDLRDISVDQTGTIVGVFSNGQSLDLAKVALASFSNPSGLDAEGGNLFSKSPNSGDAVIGTANTGGRGPISPQTLEMSNVDLSMSLTNLIVVQRGFQANSKTITTSDQMLQTLLQLKQ